MALAKDLVGAGLFVSTAKAIVGEAETGITAAGSAYTDCYRLTKPVNVVATAAASSGVGLPLGCTAGDKIFVNNDGANTVAVYPPVGGTINGGTASSGSFAVYAGGTSGRSATFICTSADGLTWTATGTQGAGVRFGDPATGIAAAGATAGSATVLSNRFNIVATATTGAGVALATGYIGQITFVRNSGVGGLKLYPPTGGTLDGGATTTGYVTLATTSESTRARVVICASADGLTWYTLSGDN